MKSSVLVIAFSIIAGAALISMRPLTMANLPAAAPEVSPAPVRLAAVDNEVVEARLRASAAEARTRQAEREAGELRAKVSSLGKQAASPKIMPPADSARRIVRAGGVALKMEATEAPPPGGFFGYMGLRPYRSYRALKSFAKGDASDVGSADYCMAEPFAAECRGTAAACAKDIESDGCVGTEPYCRVHATSSFCVGTEVFCDKATENAACTGTDRWCLLHKERVECRGSKYDCEANPRGQQCIGTSAYCKTQFDPRVCPQEEHEFSY